MNNNEFTPVITDAKKSNKKPLIVLVVAIILGLGGAGYWYLGIYQQAEYAKVAIPLYQEWDEGQSEILERSSVIFEKREAYDFTGAFAILQSLEEFLQQERTKLLLLKPPLFGITKQFHLDFSEFMDKNLETVHNTKGRTDFLIKAQAYQNLFFIKTASPTNMRSPTVSELRTQYESVLPKAKTLGSELFKEEVPGLNSVSFSELKTAWQEALPGFDLILEQIRGLDPKNPTGDQNQEIFRALALSGQKLESFNQLLNKAVQSNSIYDLLSHTGTGEVPIFTGNGTHSDATAPEELVKLALKLHGDLWDLLQKYPHLSVGHNVYPPRPPQPPAVEQQPEQPPPYEK
ncbi:MAG: hypothetical protein Q8R55_01445 [Candidatus Taylorbacteria bacterium]|nr:hypothetical protein [Candidatus Taylorbacteria bacterium]